MKRKIISVIVALAVAVTGLSLYGNSQNKDITIIRGIVIGQHANHPYISASDVVITAECEIVNENGGYLAVVLAGGDPEILGVPALIPYPSDPSYDALKRRYDAPDGLFSAIHSIDTAVPATEEVDYLAAINTAAILIQGAVDRYDGDTPLDVEMLVQGSGLSTRGEYIDFTKDILYRYEGNYQALAEEMAAAEALPNLSDIHIRWVGFGQVAAPQDRIPAMKVKAMKALWEAVLLAAGAESVTFIDSVPATEANTVDGGYQWVTPIPFAPAPTAAEGIITSPVMFAENIIGFIPGLDIYRDGSDGTPGDVLAQRALSPFAEVLIATGQSVVILGCCWDDGTGDGVVLGGLRARHVYADLIRLGVPPEQLIVASAGNLGRSVHVGGETYDFFRADQPEYSRAVWLIPLDQADEVIDRFTIC